jgi:hypothetical protein
MLENLTGFYDRHPELRDKESNFQTVQRTTDEPETTQNRRKIQSPELERSLYRLFGKEGLNSTKNKILILLLPVLMLILTIVLWRLFQYVKIHGFDEVKYAPGHGMFW